MDYSPALERRDVAIRALWRLYFRHKRGRKLLEELGLTPDAADAAFLNQPYPRTQQQLFETIARSSTVVDAAEELLRRYIIATGPERTRYYDERKHAA